MEGVHDSQYLICDSEEEAALVYRYADENNQLRILSDDENRLGEQNVSKFPFLC